MLGKEQNEKNTNFIYICLIVVQQYHYAFILVASIMFVGKVDLVLNGSLFFLENMLSCF